MRAYTYTDQPPATCLHDPSPQNHLHLHDTHVRTKNIMTNEEVVAVIAASVRRQIESDIFVPLMEKLHEVSLGFRELECPQNIKSYYHRSHHANIDLSMPLSSPTLFIIII